MRTYIYVYHKCRADKDGCPTDRVTVYRLIRNVPELVGMRRMLIGYRSEEQAVCDIILDNEPGWGRRYNSKHGSENPVNDAVRKVRYREAGKGKEAQIFRV